MEFQEFCTATCLCAIFLINDQVHCTWRNEVLCRALVFHPEKKTVASAWNNARSSIGAPDIAYSYRASDTGCVCDQTITRSSTSAAAVTVPLNVMVCPSPKSRT